MEKTGKILLAMPMYNNGETFDLSKVVAELRNHWGLKVEEPDGDSKSAAMTIEGELVALSTMPTQIPWDDILGTAQYAYNWPEATEVLEAHNSHNLVVLMGANRSDYERIVIHTKVLAAILATSNALGVYFGGQSLLIAREHYLASAESLKHGYAPIDLWVYIGVRRTPEGSSLYTYGLETFGKKEMEIIKSETDLNELYQLMTNVCAYVIKSNVTLNSGETLGYTATQKIRISQSQGVFLPTETLKLEI